MDTNGFTLDEIIQHYRDEFEQEKKNLYFFDDDNDTEHFTEKIEKYSRQTHLSHDDDTER